MAPNPPGARARPTPANIDDICASASVSAPQWPSPKLLLDSGACLHLVGDPTLLSNLRDAPVGMMVMVGDGNTLPVTKIADIQMATNGFTIPGVYFAPGVKFDVISVRELTRQSRISTWFDGDRAMLYAGRDLVGVAVALQEMNGLYILESLSVPKTAAAASSAGKLVPVWCGSSAGGSWSGSGSRSRSTSRGANFPHSNSVSSSIRENSFGSSMSSICKSSIGSVFSWLKALSNTAPLFSMQEPRVSNRRGERRRTQGEGDSCPKSVLVLGILLCFWLLLSTLPRLSRLIHRPFLS